MAHAAHVQGFVPSLNIAAGLLAFTLLRLWAWGASSLGFKQLPLTAQVGGHHRGRTCSQCFWYSHSSLLSAIQVWLSYG